MMGMKFLARCRNFSTKTPKKPSTKIKWTDEQKKIISLVEGGGSVFITGSAGTGKTFLLDQIIRVLRRVHGRSRVFVTAATGVAACSLKGQTLHLFSGIGDGCCSDPETLIERVISDKRSRWRWNRAKALVIDEISMVDALLFENLEYIARKTRNVDEVWGGIQLVVSGDFCQLPPIIPKCQSSRKEFAFEADCWDSSFDSQLELTKVFRQSDSRLVKLLQGIRRGECDPEDLQLLEKSCSDAKQDSSVVQLFPLKEDVRKVNNKQMETLGDEYIRYEAVDSDDRWKKQLNQGIAPEELALREGARVMLIKNLNPFKQLVNGATGTVVDFLAPSKCPDTKDIDVSDMCANNLLPVVKFDSGRKVVIKPELWYLKEGYSVLAQRKQIPLILAWALSIHKCQGVTLDKLHADISRAFGYGMVYVALSRVRSLDGLCLSGFDPSKIKAHPKVLQFYRSLAGECDKEADDSGDSCKNLLDPSDKSSNKGRELCLDVGEDSCNFSIDASDKPSKNNRGRGMYFSLSEFLSSRYRIR